MAGSLVKREIVSEEFEWKFEKFSLGEYRWIPDFKFQNVDWYFMVNPNVIHEYIGLSLWRKFIDSPMSVEFSVALKTSDGQKSFERDTTEIFDEGKFRCAYRWISRSEFEKRNTEFLSSGCLTVIITLKRVDFVEPPKRLHFFRSKYNNNFAPISHESLFLSTTSDADQNENASEEFEWKIDNFSLTESLHCSPEFTLQSETWMFGVYPDPSKENIDLSVKRISLGSPLLVEFSFAFKTSDGQKSFERGGTEIFDEWKVGCNYEWISISEFEKRKAEFLSSGRLTVMITLKIVDFVEPTTARATAASSCCKESLPGDKIAVDKKYLDKPIKCLNCAEIFSLQTWFDHECQVTTEKGESGTGFQPTNTILLDYKELFLSQENCDVVLRVKGQEFSAHKAILAARSPVFASTFRNDMKEKESGVVNIEDIDPSSFPEFLCFVYCGEIDNLSEETVFNIFTAADKYDITDLRTMCLNFMKNKLTVDTFCETLVLALLHNEKDLIKACTEFFVQNAEEITVSVKWLSFAAENPIQSNELFIKYIRSIKHSNN